MATRNPQLHYHVFDLLTPCWAFECDSCGLRDHRQNSTGPQGNHPINVCIRCKSLLRLDDDGGGGV